MITYSINGKGILFPLLAYATYKFHKKLDFDYYTSPRMVFITGLVNLLGRPMRSGFGASSLAKNIGVRQCERMFIKQTKGNQNENVK